MIKNVEEESDLKPQEHPSRVFQISWDRHSMKIELVSKANVSFLVTNFLLLTMNQQ